MLLFDLYFDDITDQVEAYPVYEPTLVELINQSPDVANRLHVISNCECQDDDSPF